jgi:serine/threonine protein kinase
VTKDPAGVPLDQLLDPARNASAAPDPGGQALGLAFSLRIAISLSSAIGHLHRHGIIHKDIKPGHVLVSRKPANGLRD